MREAWQGEITLAGDKLCHGDAANISRDVLVVCRCHHWQGFGLHLHMVAQRVFGHLERFSLILMTHV